MSETIFLIGFMGAGKTAIGKALAGITGYDVIDMDEQVVQEEKMEIKDIFSQFGEKYFRERESEVLKAYIGDRCIVTTGGGVILNENNRRILKESGHVIFLKCEPEIIASRLENDGTRPLIKEKTVAEIGEMYNARLPLYIECANLTVDTSNLTIMEAANFIAERLNLIADGHTS